MTSVRNAVRRGVRGPARAPQDTEGGGSPVAPANTVAPVIVGLPGVGATLVLVGDSWTGTPAPTFTYQWKRDGGDISGATSATYQIQVADIGALITCTKTGANGTAPDASANTSNSVGPVVALPSKDTDPIASVSSAVVGQTASCTAGEWTGADTYAYQWFENGAAVPGATLTTFLLSTAGASVYCRVTATNTGGSTSANSNTLGPVGLAPQNTAAPVISGTPAAGSTLTRTTGSWFGYPASYTYATKWYADGVEIAGQTGSTIVLTAVQASKLITCTVVATNSTGSSTPATSNSLGPVTSAPSFEADPVLSGIAAVDGLLTVTTIGLYGYPVPTPTYVWKADGATISGAVSSTFVPTSAQEGKTITVDVSATNIYGSDTATSNSVGPVDPPEPVAGEWDLVAADGKVLYASDLQRLVASDYTSDTLYDLLITPVAGGTMAAFTFKHRPTSGRVSWIAVPAGTFSSPNPLPADIEGWAMNPATRPSYIKWGEYWEVAGIPTAIPGIMGLIQQTDYDLYGTLRNSSAVDDFGNVLTDGFTTLDAAPVLSDVRGTAKDTTKAVLSWLTTDQTGSTKVSFYSTSATPTDDEVIAGTGALRSVITKTNTATGRVSLPDTTGLPAGQTVRAHIIQTDVNGNRSNKLTIDIVMPAVQTTAFQYANAGVSTGLSLVNITATGSQTDPLGGSNAVKLSKDPGGVSQASQIYRRTTGGVVPLTFEQQFFVGKNEWASLEAWVRWRCTNTGQSPLIHFNLDTGVFASISAQITGQVAVPMEDGFWFIKFNVTLPSDSDGDYNLYLARSSSDATIQTTGTHAITLYDYKIVSH